MSASSWCSPPHLPHILLCHFGGEVPGVKKGERRVGGELEESGLKEVMVEEERLQSRLSGNQFLFWNPAEHPVRHSHDFSHLT